MSKIYIARSPVTPLGGEHTYFVYDPDGDPYSGDERILRYGKDGDGGYAVEIDREIDESREKLPSGQDPFDDRWYTTVEEGTASAVEDTWDAMVEKAESLVHFVGDPDPLFGGQYLYRFPEADYHLLYFNCNAFTGTVGEAGGIDAVASRPIEGGDVGNGAPLPEFHYAAMDHRMGSMDDGTFEMGGDLDTVYDQGGSDTYNIDPSTLDDDQTIHIYEDRDVLSTDKIVLEDIDPGDITFKRNIDGDLLIYIDGRDEPVAQIHDQFDDSWPKINTLWAYPPGGGPPSVIPLNNPDHFSPYVPLTRPNWVEQPKPIYADSPKTGSPLILDLDGDGVEVTSLQATNITFFDIDNDGFAEQTAWVGEDDGLLVRDLDADGRITDASELFGSATVDGFAILQELDTNSDHRIDQYDAAWSELRVWIDANGDAVTNDGELHSLSSLDIVSFDLAGVSPSTSTINGNPVSHTSTFSTTAGGTGTVADVWFVHDNTYTIDNSNDFRHALTLELPNLRGFGTLPDLATAMGRDEDLLNQVHSFYLDFDLESFLDYGALDTEISEILFEWAGVADVAAGSRGGHVDAQQLSFVEVFFGEGYVQNGGGPNPMNNAGELLTEVWERIYYPMKAQLMAQAGADAIFGGTIWYNALSGEFEGDMELSEATIDLLEANAPATTTADRGEYWEGVVEFIAFSKGITNLTVAEATMLDDAITGTDVLLSLEGIQQSGLPDWLGYALSGSPDDDDLDGSAGTDVLYGGDGNDEIRGLAGNDTLHGDAGNDLIYGGDGADQILGGDGNDELYGGDDDDIIEGNAGGDYIEGGLGNDVLMPGTGGNTVRGNGGNDTYVYGGGNDVYSEYSAGGTDTILMPSGVTLGDLVFYRGGIADPDNGLMVEVDDLGVIEIEYFFTESGTPWSGSNNIETITFFDSSTYDLTDFDTLVFYGNEWGESINSGSSSGYVVDDTMFGFGGDDTLYGYYGNDVLDGGDGNDYLRGDYGDDTYIASAGYDIVSDTGSGDDVIVIPDGYDLSDVSFIRKADASGSLLITIDGLGQILVQGQFGSTGSAAIETMRFSDLSTLSLTAMNVDTVGTAGNETIHGVLSGASINDSIDGREGNDQIYGGAGDDIYWFSAGLDTINETSGSDTVRFRENYAPGDISIYRYQNDLVLEAVDGNKTTVNNHFSNTNSNASIEYVKFADTTVWSIFDIEIEARGSAGNNTIWSYALGDASADDTVFGLDGDDGIHGVYGDDTLYGGNGDDDLWGENDNDILYGEAGADLLKGGDGIDVLHGGDGDDVLYGDDGADFLYGGAGADELRGNVGADTYVFEGDTAFSGFDTIIGFSSIDIIDVADVLIGYDPLTSLITDFVEITTSGSSSVVKIDRDGAGTDHAFAQIALIQGETGLTDEQALLNSGQLLAA